MKISEILQDRIDSSIENGGYYKVIPLEKKENEIRINDYLPVGIELLHNSTGIAKIPGYYQFLDAIRVFEVNGFTFRYSSTTKQGKLLTVYFRVQKGIPGMAPRQLKPKPEPKKKETETEIGSIPGWKKDKSDRHDHGGHKKKQEINKQEPKREVKNGSSTGDGRKMAVPDSD